MVFVNAGDAAGNQFLADPVGDAPVTLDRQDWFCLSKVYIVV